jgi:hypothetical protein
MLRGNTSPPTSSVFASPIHKYQRQRFNSCCFPIGRFRDSLVSNRQMSKDVRPVTGRGHTESTPTTRTAFRLVFSVTLCEPFAFFAVKGFFIEGQRGLLTRDCYRDDFFDLRRGVSGIFSNNTTACAIAALSVPTPSGVFALMPMQSAATPVNAEIRSRIAAACGPIFGAARISV